MKYERIQKLLPLFRQSRVGYHLAMAAAAAHEARDNRRDQIMALTELSLYHAEGCLRTINELVKEGKI